MKKLILGMVLALAGLGITAAPWTNNVGVGLAVPISFIGVDDPNDVGNVVADGITQVGIGLLDLTYLGYHENGFTTKADITADLALSSDVKVQNDTLTEEKTNVGLLYDITLGAGYAFVRTEKLVVSATGTLGVEFAAYTHSYTDDDTDTHVTDGFGFAMISVGADITALYRLKEHFGLYANLSARYPIWGKDLGLSMTTLSSGNASTTTVSTLNGDLFGKFLIQPSIGMVWNF